MRYQPPIALPNEFALAAACCRWVFAGDGSERISELASAADWGRFLATCRRHRIEGLAWRALGGLGVPMQAAVRLALASDARGIAEHGLRIAAESQRLADELAAAGVKVLFLKGLTLGKLAYGDAFVKMGWDLDILVPPDAVGSAGSVLSSLGYQVELPGQASALLRWHQTRKESVWRSRGGLVVELHSRVADQPQLLAGIAAGSRSQTVAVAPGIALPTLAEEELFAYLCVHGASSAWFRLKWIADFAALLHGREPAAIERNYERALELGAGRAAAQAIILAQWLFGSPIGEAMSRRLQAGTSRWLARAALAGMLRGEPTEHLLGTRTIHLTQFFLLPGWRYKLSELARQGRAASGLI